MLHKSGTANNDKRLFCEKFQKKSMKQTNPRKTGYRQGMKTRECEEFYSGKASKPVKITFNCFQNCSLRGPITDHSENL